MSLDGTVKIADPYRAQATGREISMLAERVDVIIKLLKDYHTQGAALTQSAVGIPPPLASQDREFQGQVDNLTSQFTYFRGRAREYGAAVIDTAQKHIDTTESGVAALNNT